MFKNTIQNDKTGVWNLWVNKIQFGWYIPCLAVINAHVGHTRYWLL